MGGRRTCRVKKGSVEKGRERDRGREKGEGTAGGSGVSGETKAPLKEKVLASSREEN